MADKELELKFRASGGDQAASEAKKVSGAVDDVGSSAADVSGDVDAAVDALVSVGIITEQRKVEILS